MLFDGDPHSSSGCETHNNICCHVVCWHIASWLRGCHRICKLNSDWPRHLLLTERTCVNNTGYIRRPYPAKQPVGDALWRKLSRSTVVQKWRTNITQLDVFVLVLTSYHCWATSFIPSKYLLYCIYIYIHSTTIIPLYVCKHQYLQSVCAGVSCDKWPSRLACWRSAWLNGARGVEEHREQPGWMEGGGRRALLVFHRLNHEQSCNMAVSVMEVLSRQGVNSLDQQPDPQLLPTKCSADSAFQLHSVNFNGIKEKRKLHDADKTALSLLNHTHYLLLCFFPSLVLFLFFDPSLFPSHLFLIFLPSLFFLFFSF